MFFVQQEFEQRYVGDSRERRHPGWRDEYHCLIESIRKEERIKMRKRKRLMREEKVETSLGRPLVWQLRPGRIRHSKLPSTDIGTIDQAISEQLHNMIGRKPGAT